VGVGPLPAGVLMLVRVIFSERSLDDRVTVWMAPLVSTKSGLYPIPR
jgi:hypothetical protein